MLLVSTTRIIPGRAVPSFLSGRYPAVKVRKKLYVTPLRGCEGRVRKIDRHKRMAYLRFDEGGEGDCVLQAALNVPVKN